MLLFFYNKFIKKYFFFLYIMNLLYIFVIQTKTKEVFM